MAYGKVERHMWHDDKFRALSRDARDVFLYLLTCPHGNRLGCFVLDRFYAAADLQIEPSVIDAAIQELADAGRVDYDRSNRLVLIRQFLKHNPWKNPNVVTAAIGDLHTLPRSDHLLRQLGVSAQLHKRAHYKPFLESLAKLLGQPLGDKTANQEQELEQELEPEQEPEPFAHARDGDGDPVEEAQRVMWEALDDASIPPSKRNGFTAVASMIISGDNMSAWQGPDGGQVAWAGRPRLFRLALARCQAEDRWGSNDLHSALRYVVPQQLDPRPIAKNNRPPADSPAGQILGQRSDDIAIQQAKNKRERDIDREVEELDRYAADNPDVAGPIHDAAYADAGDDPIKKMAAQAVYRSKLREHMEAAA